MTSHLPDPVRRLAQALAELPSLGPRQAMRIAIALAGREDRLTEHLAAALTGLRDIKICSSCFFLHAGRGDRCEICADHTRDPRTILVVEKETDLISIENTGKYRGRYLVLGLVPKVGGLAAWQEARLKTFIGHIKKESAGMLDEIILAFNSTAYGDVSANLVAKELAPHAKKLTRLGRGLPTGGEIEFADDETLGNALEGRG